MTVLMLAMIGVRREGRRSVENEQLLIDALVQLVGRRNLHV